MMILGSKCHMKHYNMSLKMVLINLHYFFFILLFAKSYYHIVALHCIPFRFLTYSFLWAYNGWLLINPSTLCYDWQGGSIELVESLCDHRNLATVMAMALVFFLGYVSYMKLKVTTDIQITMHNSLMDCLIVLR